MVSFANTAVPLFIYVSLLSFLSTLPFMQLHSMSYSSAAKSSQIIKPLIFYNLTNFVCVLYLFIVCILPVVIVVLYICVCMYAYGLFGSMHISKPYAVPIKIHNLTSNRSLRAAEGGNKGAWIWVPWQSKLHHHMKSKWCSSHKWRQVCHIAEEKDLKDDSANFTIVIYESGQRLSTVCCNVLAGNIEESEK